MQAFIESYFQSQNGIFIADKHAATRHSVSSALIYTGVCTVQLHDNSSLKCMGTITLNTSYHSYIYLHSLVCLIHTNWKAGVNRLIPLVSVVTSASNLRIEWTIYALTVILLLIVGISSEYYPVIKVSCKKLLLKLILKLVTRPFYPQIPISKFQ